MRFALLYSDGSVGILRAEASLDEARKEREWVDRNERDPRHLTKIACVTFDIVEIVDDPTTAPAPPASGACPVCGSRRSPTP